jgi:hypothetical protein
MEMRGSRWVDGGGGGALEIGLAKRSRIERSAVPAARIRSAAAQDARIHHLAATDQRARVSDS